MPGLGGGRERGSEARERELAVGRGGVGIAGGAAVAEGGGQAGEEEGGASGEAEGAGGEQGQEVDEDGQPDRELDGVLGVTQEAGQVEVVLEPAEEQLDLP